MGIDAQIPLSVNPVRFNDPFQVLQQIRDQSRQREQDKQRKQLVEQQIQSGNAAEEDRREQTAARKRAQSQEELIDNVMQSAMTQNTDGVYVIDRAKFDPAVVQAGMGHKLPEYAKQFDVMEANAAKTRQQHLNNLAEAGYAIALGDHSPESVAFTIAPMIQNGSLRKNELKPYLELIDKNPDQIPNIAERLMSLDPAVADKWQKRGAAAATQAHTEAETKKLSMEMAGTLPPTPAQIASSRVVPGSKEDILTRFARERGKSVADLTTAELGQADRLANPTAPTESDKKRSDPRRASVVAAIQQNPEILDRMTNEAFGDLLPDLVASGFKDFGKSLPQAAVVKISDAKSAVKSLEDLREVLKANEQYIGPVAGLAALNPYSDARKAQADIDRVRQRVGKSLEGGVLRKEDEEKYKKILATLTDKPETAIYKVDQLIQSFTNDMDAYIGTQRQAGRRTTGVTGGTALEPPKIAHGVGDTVIGPDGKKHKVLEVSPDGKQVRLDSAVVK